MNPYLQDIEPIEDIASNLSQSGTPPLHHILAQRYLSIQSSSDHGYISTELFKLGGPVSCCSHVLGVQEGVMLPMIAKLSALGAIQWDISIHDAREASTVPGLPGAERAPQCFLRIPYLRGLWASAHVHWLGVPGRGMVSMIAKPKAKPSEPTISAASEDRCIVSPGHSLNATPKTYTNIWWKTKATRLYLDKLYL